MSLDKTKFAVKTDAASSYAPNIFTYNSTDDLSAVGYFNDVYYALKEGDFIFQYDGNTKVEYVVSDITDGVVTVAEVA